MKLFAPKYYEKFKCIASACRHSCCVNWEIRVDEETLEKYKGLTVFGKPIIETVDFTEEPHFRLCADGRCPHLNENGLCNIICECGEEYLSEICREHPRFFNTVGDRCEVGLGAVCEAAAEIILDSDYTELCEVGSIDIDGSEAEFDTLGEREKLFALLSDRSRPYAERLSAIYESYGVFPKRLTDTEWRSVISELEYLAEDSREKFLAFTSDAAVTPEREIYLERALAYFIYRQVSPSESYAEFLSSLGLALFLERLFASLLAKGGSDSPSLTLRLISEEIEYSEDNVEEIKLSML